MVKFFKSQDNYLERFLSPEDRQTIKDAIKQVESTSSLEVVTAITRRSTNFWFVEPLLFLNLLALCLLCGWIYRAIVPLPLAHPYLWLGLFVAGSAVAADQLARIGFLKRWITPNSILQSACEQRAQLAFYHYQLDHSQHHAGVLIFISLEEHRAVILADKTVAAEVPNVYWPVMVHDMTAKIAAGDVRGAFLEAIGRLGAEVAYLFPAEPKAANELPDHLIVLKD